MRSGSETRFQGDTGKWEEENQRDEYIWESPEVHLFTVLVGGSSVFSFFSIVFLTIYIDTDLLSIFAIFLSPLAAIILLTIIMVSNPQTGYLSKEVMQLIPEDPNINKRDISSKEVMRLLKSEDVVSDWEIAAEVGCSIGSVRSRLSQMESEGEIRCKQISSRSVVCWRL